MAPVDDSECGGDARDEPASLDIGYTRHERIEELIDVVRFCLEAISLRFDRWDEPHIRGPGFYLALVSGTSVEEYADPMGANRWPIETCRNVFDDLDAFHRAASTTAANADGAVIATIDGVLQPRMVRITDPGWEVLAAADARASYEDWMGSRHMNALDTSTRDDVVATITLSEENGRVTVFVDGEFEDYSRTELGGRWRASS